MVFRFYPATTVAIETRCKDAQNPPPPPGVMTHRRIRRQTICRGTRFRSKTRARYDVFERPYTISTSHTHTHTHHAHNTIEKYIKCIYVVPYNPNARVFVLRCPLVCVSRLREFPKTLFLHRETRIGFYLFARDSG